MSGKTLTWLACGLVAAAAAAAPSLALAGTGPYVGLEAGGNWVAGEDYLPPPPGHQKKAVFGAIGGVVAGYSFANGLRPELEISYRWNELRSGKGLSSVPSGMANLWYDFSLPPSWHVSKLHPYVGGGVGFGRIDPTLSSKFKNAYRSVFLYQGGAGLDYDITNRLTASIGWRWIQSSTAAFAGSGTHQGYGRYRANSALLGVRYSFGSEEPVQAAPPPPPPPPVEQQAAPTPPPVKESADQKFENVHFAFDKSNLSDYAKASLNGDAKTINKLVGQYPDLQVDVAGHTDWIGTEAYNQALSERRATSVRKYLETRGVEGNRIRTFAYGETRPIAPNTTAEGRAQNRRAEIRTHSASADSK